MENEILKGQRCQYCDKKTELIRYKYINPKFNKTWLGTKWFWYCKDCKAWVGCHPRTKDALGSVANKKLRVLRNKAHESFDLLWKFKAYVNSEKINEYRSKAYDWLAKEMNKDVGETHIGYFDEKECGKVMALSGNWLYKIRLKYRKVYNEFKRLNSTYKIKQG